MQPAAQTERESRVGKRLVPLPKGVNVAINGRQVKIEGPKGKLALDLPPQVTAKKDGDALKVESSAGGRDARRLQGLGRALLSSMVKGASQGYEKIL
jgi:large subunit ribosomal protein L6